MLKQLENDTILERMERLLGDIQSPRPKFGLSVFVLPPRELPLERIEGDSHHVFFGKEVTEGTVYWMWDRTEGMDDDEVGVDDILKELASWRWLADMEKPRTVDVAFTLLDIALGDRFSGSTKPPLLRGAWDDPSAAERWVDDWGMLKCDFTKERPVTTEGWIDSPDYALDNEEYRGWLYRAKYWWVDIPDLTGLLGSILPAMYRFREKYLLDGMTITEAVMWELKKDIAHCTLSHNTSNRKLAVRYGCNVHTIEKAVAMLDDKERGEIPYGKESKKALNRSVRGIRNMTWSADRMEENKIEFLRERLKDIYYDSANLTREAAEDRVMAIEPDKLQEEIESCLDNL